MIMNTKEALEKFGSIRKAASELGLTKSKFMVQYKKELGLCTATTACKNTPEPGKTRCKDHLRYAVKTRNPIKKRESYKIWRDNNVEHRSKYMFDYQRNNKERVNALHRAWSKTEKGKIVNRAKMAYRRAMKLQATPDWVDRKELKAIYAGCPEGYHVDHIIPLINDQVCGLHVPCNLQYLTAFDNDSKGDKFDGTYDNTGWKRAE